jgi:hypothetical protein
MFPFLFQSRRANAFLTAGKQDHIAGMNLLDRTALSLRPTATRYDNESLVERMGMPPVRAPGSNVTLAAGSEGRSVGLKQGIDA